MCALGLSKVQCTRMSRLRMCVPWVIVHVCRQYDDIFHETMTNSMCLFSLKRGKHLGMSEAPCKCICAQGLVQLSPE